MFTSLLLAGLLVLSGTVGSVLLISVIELSLGLSLEAVLNDDGSSLESAIRGRVN